VRSVCVSCSSRQQRLTGRWRRRPSLNRSSGERVASKEEPALVRYPAERGRAACWAAYRLASVVRPASAELDRPGALIPLALPPAKKARYLRLSCAVFATMQTGGGSCGLAICLSHRHPVSKPAPSLHLRRRRTGRELAARYSACPSGPTERAVTAQGIPRAKFRRALAGGPSFGSPQDGRSPSPRTWTRAPSVCLGSEPSTRREASPSLTAASTAGDPAV
jgi:hypothetical protein